MAKEYIERAALPQKRERGFFMEDDFNSGWNACLYEIEKLPVTDVRENVKGTWRDKKLTVKGGYGLTYGRWGCSVCKKKQEFRTPYCPNCGAKMDGEDGDKDG